MQPIYNLSELRNKNPVHEYCREGSNEICEIHYSSEHKLNIFIRDMGDEGLCLYTKGAPENILVRCSRIFLKG